jgi:hypothetical protein
MVTIPKNIYCVAYLHMATSTRVMSSCQIIKNASGIRETNMCVLRHIIYDIIHRVSSPHIRQFTLWIVPFILRCSGTACKLLTRWLYPARQLRYGRVCHSCGELYSYRRRVSLYKGVTRSDKRLSQGFWMHTPWPRIYGKSRRHSTPHMARSSI